MTSELDAPFTILCVCTGNVCRSPVAERLLATRLGPDVRVASAGTFGLTGRGIEPEMVAQLTAAGVPEVEFVARRMTAADVRGADLVLGLGREHRSQAVELVPAAVRRSFTLLEFARLVATIAPEELPHGSVADRLRAAVPLAAARRRRVASADLDDVADPYRQHRSAYDASFVAIRTAVDTIADRVLPYSGLLRT
jgi:protein-tyrosine phosphatase